jgi:hypothetical protein
MATVCRPIGHADAIMQNKKLFVHSLPLHRAHRCACAAKRHITSHASQRSLNKRLNKYNYPVAAVP